MNVRELYTKQLREQKAKAEEVYASITDPEEKRIFDVFRKRAREDRD